MNYIITYNIENNSINYSTIDIDTKTYAVVNCFGFFKTVKNNKYQYQIINPFTNTADFIIHSLNSTMPLIIDCIGTTFNITFKNNQFKVVEKIDSIIDNITTFDNIADMVEFINHMLKCLK